ncbi:MAG: sulfotransferase family protein [Planctomycetaceae bacterium]
MPFLMIGTQRSGSNLLRLMINQLPGIVAPHPPHIMERMGPLLPEYGPLTLNAFSQLIEDICWLIEANPVPWDGVVLNRGEIHDRCQQRSLASVFRAVYDMLADASRADDWCCKSLANVHYLQEIESIFCDSARYIHLYRDGRDVALSFRKAIVGDKHWYHLAKQWNAEQQLALQLQQQIPADRFFSVQYEELTANPEKILRGLCDFMGQTYRPEMMNYHESSEADRTATAGAMWANVGQPVKSDNSRKYLTQASEDELRIFESVAGSALSALGYERHFIQPGQELIFSSETLQQFDEENKQLQSAVLEQTAESDLRKREPQAVIMRIIKHRLSLSAPSGVSRSA